MANISLIGPEEVAGRLTWNGVVEAMEQGHCLPKAKLGDQLLTRGDDALLSRSAWVVGLGIGVKSVTVMPDNADKGLPSIDGGMLVFEDRTGRLEAVIDSNLVTEWKTAADSILGARLLARPESERLLILGAGVVAESLIRAYSEVFPALRDIAVWNRTAARAEALVRTMTARGFPVRVTRDLASEAAAADIISTATMTRDPILHGAWITPGTHVDLIGAFTPEMREADNELIGKAAVFVDCLDTTIDHIGELMIPIADGVLRREEVGGDLYDLIAGRCGRRGEDEITFYKNGGGAHLDLMTAKVIIAAAIAGA